ncbi:MAG: hypothetical protein ACU0C9_14135 [Paracoccaceae bacterium]
MIAGSEIDRLIFHMPTVARKSDNVWATGFANSILKQSRRRNWKPSDKQLEMMRRLVRDLFTKANDEALTEDFNAA